MDPSTIEMIMQAGSSIPDILSGLFGNYGKPYREAGKELDRYLPQAQQYQNPFYQMGTGAIPQYQNFLDRMKNPSDFINNLMGQYQESPWAKYQQQQGIRSAQNMGSASGLTGSTPLTQFAEQQAQGISSQDMQNWLGRVLGINTSYGSGLGNEITGGQYAGNALTDLFSNYMGNKAGLRWNEEGAEQGQQGQLFGGLGKFFFG